MIVLVYKFRRSRPTTRVHIPSGRIKTRCGIPINYNLHVLTTDTAAPDIRKCHVCFHGVTVDGKPVI